MPSSVVVSRGYFSREFVLFARTLPHPLFPNRVFRQWICSPGVKVIYKNRAGKLARFVSQVGYDGVLIVKQNPFSLLETRKRIKLLRPHPGGFKRKEER